MAKTQLPEVHFSRGMVIRRLINTVHTVVKPRDYWYVIGNLSDGTPFFLAYELIPSWASPKHLGEPLRRKILREFKARIESAPHLSFIQQHDLTSIPDDDSNDPRSASQLALGLYLAFFNGSWRAETLNDRDEDYVWLNVPFAEKDDAKRLGAEWRSVEKKWRVKQRGDMSPFARWLPSA